MLHCKIKAKYNYKKIENLPSKLIEKTSEGLEEVLNNIKGYAIRLERGHNSQGIIVEMVETSTKQIKGRVYADPHKFMTPSGISYLWFEYFGTVGKSKHFLETNYEEWYIPVSKAGRGLNYPIVTFGNSQFYVAHGAKANHFLTDAEFKSRSENKEIIINKLNEMIKEVCK